MIVNLCSIVIIFDSFWYDTLKKINLGFVMSGSNSNERKKGRAKRKKRDDSSSKSSEEAVVVADKQTPTLPKISITLVVGVLVPLTCALLYATKWWTMWSIFYNIVGYGVSFFVGGESATTVQPPSMLTTHFLGALNEISTSIPKLNMVAISPTKSTQHTIRRKQIDMIENLGFTSSMIDEPDLVKKIIGLKDQIYSVHKVTAGAEDAFKDAISEIDKVTAFILKELPVLGTYLAKRQQCLVIMEHLGVIIKRIGALTLDLESAIIPITQLRVEVTSLVSNIGIVDAHLQYIAQKTNIGLVSHDRESEAYRTASRFTLLSKPDQQKYEYMVLLNRQITTMQTSTQFLDDTFEKSETQVNLALDHLRGTTRQLTNIYIEMGLSMNRLEEEKLGQLGEKVYFNDGEVKLLTELNQQIIGRIDTIRKDNEPVLRNIMIYGYGAIEHHTS
jgi:hypothetical protein